MNIEELRKQSFSIAARAAQKRCLNPIYDRIDGKNTVSTFAIERDLEQVENFLSDCAVQIRKLLDVIGE